MKGLNETGKQILEFFFPVLCCPVCSEFHQGLCMTCKASFKLNRKVSLMEEDGASLYRHDEEVMALISNYKKKMIFTAGKAMAKLILEEYEEELRRFDFVTFAPSSRSSMKRLGFDHGLLLAKEVAKPLGIPVVSLFTPPKREQKVLDREERIDNAKNIGVRKQGFNELKGKSGVIIDDVYTTGSTMKECLNLMSERGVKGRYLTFSRI